MREATTTRPSHSSLSKRPTLSPPLRPLFKHFVTARPSWQLHHSLPKTPPPPRPPDDVYTRDRFGSYFSVFTVLGRRAHRPRFPLCLSSRHSRIVPLNGTHISFSLSLARSSIGLAFSRRASLREYYGFHYFRRRASLIRLGQFMLFPAWYFSYAFNRPLFLPLAFDMLAH